MSDGLDTHYTASRVRVVGSHDYREIWLSRVSARNAFDTAMRDQLFEVLTAIAVSDQVRSVALLADGPDFCAGGDLTEFGTTPDPATAFHVRMLRSVPQLLIRIGPRLFAGVHGAAVGAGIEMAAFARVLVASSDARFKLPEISMGLIPGAGGTVSISRRMGRARAFELMLTGSWISAQEALEHGLVDEVAGKGELVARVRELANR